MRMGILLVAGKWGEKKRKPTLKLGVGWENNDISKNLMLFT